MLYSYETIILTINWIILSYRIILCGTRYHLIVYFVKGKSKPCPVVLKYGKHALVFHFPSHTLPTLELKDLKHFVSFSVCCRPAYHLPVRYQYQMQRKTQWL